MRDRDVHGRDFGWPPGTVDMDSSDPSDRNAKPTPKVIVDWGFERVTMLPREEFARRPSSTRGCWGPEGMVPLYGWLVLFCGYPSWL